LSAACRNHFVKDRLLAAVVELGVELELPAVSAAAHSPSGETSGNFGNVLLSVSAVDAKRVKLHQLTGVVLIQPSHLRASGRRT